LALGFHFAAFAAEPSNSKMPMVFVKKSKLSDVSQSLSYPAVVQARVQATVLAESDGVIKKIHVNLGQPIRGGARLFTVQQTDPIYRYAAVATPAPVTGIISELDITEGALVAKGQKLATVTDPASVKVLVEVPAQDLPLIQKDLIGELDVPALSKKVPLTIQGISPSVDPATGTASAELAPSKRDAALIRPGLVGKVTFRANVHRGFLVPEDALVENQTETFLRIVEDGKARKIPVTVVSRSRGQAEISKGLKEGQMVVERASGFIGDGEAVKIQE
jgi:multidrug efflux pump subunit AcrA (membrane-fusion protein)